MARRKHAAALFEVMSGDKKGRNSAKQCFAAKFLLVV